MGKLKPCPFCGGEAMIEVIEPHTHTMATFMPDYEGGAFIECQCGAGISGKTIDDVIAAWEKRTHEKAEGIRLHELIRKQAKELNRRDVIIKQLNANIDAAKSENATLKDQLEAADRKEKRDDQ